MDELNFMNMREEAYKYRVLRERRIFSKWLSNIIKNDISFAYKIDRYNKKVSIYTNKPGAMIGYHGEGVDKLKEILKEEFREEYLVEFVEIDQIFLMRVQNVIL